MQTKDHAKIPYLWFSHTCRHYKKCLTHREPLQRWQLRGSRTPAGYKMLDYSEGGDKVENINEQYTFDGYEILRSSQQMRVGKFKNILSLEDFLPEARS